MATRKIEVKTLTRVEGEGGFALKLIDGTVRDVRLEIFEPPRLFEAFLRGRSFLEAADLVARICGICPVAHQIAAVLALENGLGIEPPAPTRMLRRLLLCGEWIESHALHVFLLHAPDFLGYPDAMHMGRDHPEVLRRGLELKKIGNLIMTLLGGREIHPVTMKVGGFYRTPAKGELAPVKERLKWACDAAVETVRWAAALPYPDFERSYELVALRHGSEYPMIGGHLVSSTGWDLDPSQYETCFMEEQVPYSNALHSRAVEGGTYLVGPLARYNLSFDRLSPAAKEAARSADLHPPVSNPFKSIAVRAVELLHACEEALRLIEAYEPAGEAAVEARPRASTGCGITEAPRGTLYHRYRMDEKGLIIEARIVPPTAQNQKVMEDDLRELALRHHEMPRQELTRLCEQAIRNHDPCISCATHLLKVEPR